MPKLSDQSRSDALAWDALARTGAPLCVVGAVQCVCRDLQAIVSGLHSYMGVPAAFSLSGSYCCTLHGAEGPKSFEASVRFSNSVQNLCGRIRGPAARNTRAARVTDSQSPSLLMCRLSWAALRVEPATRQRASLTRSLPLVVYPAVMPRTCTRQSPCPVGASRLRQTQRRGMHRPGATSRRRHCARMCASASDSPHTHAVSSAAQVSVDVCAHGTQRSRRALVAQAVLAASLLVGVHHPPGLWRPSLCRAHFDTQFYVQKAACQQQTCAQPIHDGLAIRLF